MKNSLTPLLGVLKELGLNEKETKVYIFLAKKGSQKVSSIASQTKINRVQLYSILKSLQQKQIVKKTNTYPTIYTANSIENTLNLFINTKEKDIEFLKSNKNQFLSKWNQLKIENKENSKDRFMVIEGTKYVQAKMKQMLQNTKEIIRLVTPYPGIIQAYQAGIFETGFSHPLRDKIKFQFLLSIDDLPLDWSMINELFSRAKKEAMSIDAHIADLGSINFPRYVIVDESELLFSLHPSSDSPLSDKNNIGLWTNNKILIIAFKIFFERIWINSIDFLESFQQS